MKGITEDNLRAELLQFLRGHRLDRAIGTHRHKGRRVNHAARKFQPCPARQAVDFVEGEFHKLAGAAELAINIASP